MVSEEFDLLKVMCSPDCHVDGTAAGGLSLSLTWVTSSLLAEGPSFCHFFMTAI